MGLNQLLHVFLAEDNSADVYLVQEALRRAALNYQLHLASDGEEAVAMIGRFGADLPCPNIALLDLNLPRQAGTEVLELWREHPHCAGIPIVIFTSSEAPSDQQLAVDHDAVFFRKPLDMDEFFQLGPLVRDLCLPRAYPAT